MSPPVAAAVFVIDEKPQIQALNRSAPTLPTTPAKATHEYVRNGTIDLLAALEIATGKVITDLRRSHTAADFIAFLNKIDAEVPADLDVLVILDNLSSDLDAPGPAASAVSFSSSATMTYRLVRRR